MSHIGALPVKPFENVVKERNNQGANEWTNPVDPVVSGKRMVDNSRAECSCRIDASTGEFDTWGGMTGELDAL